MNNTDRQHLRQAKVVDSNEPWTMREPLLITGWTPGKLYSADYWFWTINYKKVGIERKTVSDLINSLNDRLTRQLLNMTEYYDFCILLIEGNWKMLSNNIMTDRGTSQWGWSVVWNYLLSWENRGIAIQLTVDEKHTVKRLNELYAYYQKPGHCAGIAKHTVDDSRILALQCGGIGNKLGKELLDKFGSLKNIANAGIDDFTAIDKIGKAKAEALYRHFNNGND